MYSHYCILCDILGLWLASLKLLIYHMQLPKLSFCWTFDAILFFLCLWNKFSLIWDSQVAESQYFKLRELMNKSYIIPWKLHHHGSLVQRRHFGILNPEGLIIFKLSFLEFSNLLVLTIKFQGLKPHQPPF